MKKNFQKMLWEARNGVDSVKTLRLYYLGEATQASPKICPR